MPSTPANRFPRLTSLLTLMVFLFMLVGLLLTLLNPRFQVYQDAHDEQPVLHLYIDTSLSMYPYADEVEDFFEQANQWPGKLLPQFFSSVIEPIPSLEIESMDDLPPTWVKWVKSPTLFSAIQENLFFANREHYHAVVSDFLFRDGFTDFNVLGGENVDLTNRFYFHPGSGNIHTSTPAVFILNRDNRILPDGSYVLKLLFYSGVPTQKLEYRVYYQTPESYSRNRQQKKLVRTGEITTEDHYFEIEAEISLPTLEDEWIHLNVEMRNGKSYSDQINLLSSRKKTFIQMIYFQINRDAFAVKNSLDRYWDYQVDTLYLGGRTSLQAWSGVEQQIQSMIPDRDIFFLVSPPSYILKWFREKKIPFVHIPSVSQSSPQSSWVGVTSTEIDYDLSPMDFLGERNLSEARWKEVISRLRGLPLELKNGDIAFHRLENKSAFFLRDSEMYWGIHNLYFLNDNILQDQDESYWDIFLIKMIDFLQERMGDQTVDISHNFFLGEKVTDDSFPHVIQLGENYHITPELSRAGSYPAPANLPPYNYRIPFNEFFPPPVSGIRFADQEQFLNWMATLKEKPIPQVEREITFRELPIYGYLLALMIGLFLVLLAIKWYDNRRFIG